LKSVTAFPKIVKRLRRDIESFQNFVVGATIFLILPNTKRKIRKVRITEYSFILM